MEINILAISLIFVNIYKIEGAEIAISTARGGCPAGSIGEFATFGFLSFLVTLLNTILNLGNSTN